MQTLKSFLDQSLIIWKDSTGAARIGILLLFLICIGAIIGVGIWSAQTNYIALTDNVGVSQLANVGNALDQANIDWTQRGSSIHVDENQRIQATLIIQELGLLSDDEFVTEQPNIWTDPRSRQETDRRNLEKQIAHQIKRFSSVENTSVILSMPKYEPFSRKSHLPTASVIVEIGPNSNFNESDASAIASMVANSVPGLTIGNVSISDRSGFKYQVDDSFRHHLTQGKYRLHEEMSLSQKAEDILSRTLGFGNAIVKVNTSFSFPDAHVKEVKYDTENKFTSRETIQSSNSKGGSDLAAGAAGTDSNVGGRGYGSGSKSIDSTQEEITKDVKAPVTEREEHLRTPILETMTVSVLINSKDLADETNSVPAELKERYEAIVKNAIGFSQARGDQISLEFFPFIETMPLEELAAPFPWEQVHLILKNISLGLAGLVALLLGVRAFQKLTPIPEIGNNNTNATNRETQLKQLSAMVKENPEVFSQIISAWSNSPMADEETSTAPTQTTSRRAA